MPTPMPVALVPVLGVTFLMFMPVAGFVVLGQHLWGKVLGLFVRAPAASASSAPPAQGDRPPAPQG